jgi:hypothetical protein
MMKLSIATIPLLGLSLFAVSVVPAASPLLKGSVRADEPPDRYVQVQETRGTVTSQGQPVKEGDRLPVAEVGLSTSLGGSAILLLDDGIGTLNISEGTELRVKNLETKSDGSKTTRFYVDKGQVRSKVRPFTNPNSKYEIETPGGVAGSRGTDFGITVDPRGKTGIAGASGKVAVTAQGRTVMVEPGYSSLILPGEAPAKPSISNGDTRLRLKLLSVTQDNQVRVIAEFNPIDLVTINARVVDTGRDGKLDTAIPLPANRVVQVVVRSPLGNQQIYELEIPSTPNS